MAGMLLTEAEVAERLRRSKQTVRRLRLGGKLRYLPGRPPMIDEADLNEFLENEKREAARKADRKQRVAKAEGQSDVAEMKSRVRRNFLRRQMREESK